jgi:hypothetical protein
MTIDTYANLQTAVLNWINRSGDSDAVSRCPEWITLAEGEIIAELSSKPLRQGETSNPAYTISSEYQALPSGFLRMRGNILISGSPNTYIEYDAPENINRRGLMNGVNGKPKIFTIQGNQFRFSPVPDSSYTATLNYQALPVLSSSNTTNWLLTAYPGIYLHAALAQADRYYRDVPGFQADDGIWRNLFANAFTADGPSANASSLQMRTDNGNP